MRNMLAGIVSNIANIEWFLVRNDIRQDFFYSLYFKTLKLYYWIKRDDTR